MADSPTPLTPLVLHVLCEMTGRDPECRVLDVIVLREGLGKNRIRLPDGQEYTEYFTPEFLTSLHPLLEGAPVQAIKFEPTARYSHPPADINRVTPAGLIGNVVGWLKHVTLDTIDGKLVNRAKLILSDVAEALHIRQLLQAAVKNNILDVIGVSINGEGLFVPGIRDGLPVIEAVKASLLRSVELVSSPAAGGRILAVLEEERTAMRTLQQAVRQYCDEKQIPYNKHAKTAQSVVASIDPTVRSADNILTQAAAYLESGQDQNALAVMNGVLPNETEAELTPPEAAHDAPASDAAAAEDALALTPEANETMLDTIEEQLKATERLITEARKKKPVAVEPDAEDTVAADVAECGTGGGGGGKGAMPANVMKKKKGAPVAASVAEGVYPPDVAAPVGTAEPEAGYGAVLRQLADGQNTLLGAVTSMQGVMAQVIQAQRGSLAFMRNVQQSTQATQQEQEGQAMLMLLRNAQIPEPRKAFYQKQYEQGRVNASALRLMVSEEVTETAKLVAQMGGVLPMGYEHLAATVTSDARDRNVLRAKLLFAAPLTESEQKTVTEYGVTQFRGIRQFYDTYIPGDEALTGRPYGGRDCAEARTWQRNILEGSTETMDFSTILKNVLDQRAVARWRIREMLWQQVLEEGTPFTDYRDANVIVPSQASDIPEVTETGGYTVANNPHRKREVVVDSAKEYGRILRWTKRVILNDTTDMITDDSDAEVDAMYNTLARLVWDYFLGFKTAACNDMTLPDGDLLYNAATRKNYVVGSVDDYDKMVALANLMQQQYDDAAPGFTAQPLEMTPFFAICANTKAGWVRGTFTGAYKPGTQNVPNNIAFPDIRVIPLHPAYLRGHSEFLGLHPNPALYAGLRIRYFQGQRTPRLVWQNQPQVGRVFDYGDISMRIEMPVRLTLIRKRAFYALAQF